MGKQKPKPTVALIYDFDGTLAPGNIQEVDFIPAIKSDKSAFWAENTTLSKDNDADQILTYMYLMLTKARSGGISLKRESFKEFGRKVEFFQGVESWFKMINEYGKQQGLNIEHYINSSGLKEMIEGTSIAKEFKNIFACSYLYDVDGIAYWPAVAVDYTTKTQFLFKINKGISSVAENKKINQYIKEEDRPIQFKHMIYFGDGETDVPCMKLIKEKAGHSIAVFTPHNKKKKAIAENLIADKRVNFVCPADYTEGKEIHKVVTTILDKIKADSDFSILLEKHKEKATKEDKLQDQAN